MQLRLDFQTFVIAGPSTVTSSQFKTLNGQLVNLPAASTTGFVPGNTNTQCLTDTFSVSDRRRRRRWRSNRIRRKKTNRRMRRKRTNRRSKKRSNRRRERKRSKRSKRRRRRKVGVRGEEK